MTYKSLTFADRQAHVIIAVLHLGKIYTPMEYVCNMNNKLAYLVEVSRSAPTHLSSKGDTMFRQGLQHRNQVQNAEASRLSLHLRLCLLPLFQKSSRPPVNDSKFLLFRLCLEKLIVMISMDGRKCTILIL